MSSKAGADGEEPGARGGERGRCSSSVEARQVPSSRSQPAVHLRHLDRSQREVTCGAQVPRPRSRGLWSGGSLVTSPHPSEDQPLRSCLSKQTGTTGQVPAWGPRTGAAEPEFKLIPALSSDLLSTYCVPGARPRAAGGRTLTHSELSLHVPPLPSRSPSQPHATMWLRWLQSFPAPPPDWKGPWELMGVSQLMAGCEPSSIY